MQTLKKTLASAAMFVALASPGLAGRPPILSEVVDAIAIDGEASAKAFVGLNWTFGASPTPELVLGVAQGQTLTDGTLVGGKAAVFVDVGGGFAFDKFKLTGLYGTSDIQGELGLGYNFQRGNIFGVVGANGSNFAAGVDVYGGMTLEPYAGIHSIGLFGDFGYTCVGVPDPDNNDYVWSEPILDGSECEFEGFFIDN